MGTIIFLYIDVLYVWLYIFPSYNLPKLPLKQII